MYSLRREVVVSVRRSRILELTRDESPTRWLDMNDVVHRDGSHSPDAGGTKATWCEAIDDDFYFTAASLRETDKPVTCLRCLGLT